MTSSQANETVRNLLPINDGRNLEESVVGDGIDTRGRDGTDDDKVDDDTIKKLPSRIAKPSFKRMMTIKKEDTDSTLFLVAAMKPCGFKIYIDDLLEKLPYQIESESPGDIQKRIDLFVKLDTDKDQKLSLEEILGLKKHLLIANNFECDVLIKYAF